MTYFKEQKESQKDIENYFIPASVETLQELHSTATLILIKIKYKQELIEMTKEYIERTQIEKSKQEQLKKFDELVEEKRMLMETYRKIFIQIAKQNESI
jgi:hypothetical protein